MEVGRPPRENTIKWGQTRFIMFIPCFEQVHVIGHPHGGVPTQTEALCGFDHTIAEESVILLSGEDGLAVIPAQDKVLRLAGNEVAG